MNLSFQRLMCCKRIHEMYNRIIGVEVKKINWDYFNSRHIQKHNVSIREVEKILRSKDKIVVETYKNRYLVFGRISDRLISCVISKETEECFYVVTARDMSKKERRYFYEQNKNST